MTYSDSSDLILDLDAQIQALQECRDRMVHHLKASVSDDDPLLTNAEAGRYVGWSKPGFDRLRYKGKGPDYFKMGEAGRKIYYRKSALDAWLESQKVSTCSLGDSE